MRNGRALGAAWWGRLSVSVLLVVAAGCAMLPPQSFIDPTKVGQFPTNAKEGGIRRVLTPRDTPPGIAGATEPTPDDLVPNYAEYQIGPSDTIAVTVQNLLGNGEPFSAAFEVNSLGEIDLPQVGSIRIAGLTEKQAKLEIANRIREAGILPDPIVILFIQSKRSRTFNVLGAIAASGLYPITDPEMRLLDAIALARDAGADAKKLYVIRRGQSETTGGGTPPPNVPTPQPVNDGLIIPPPSEEGPTQVSFLTQQGGQKRNFAARAAPQDADRQELENALSPKATSTGQATGKADQRAFEPIAFDPQSGKLLEPSAPAQQTQPSLPKLDLDKPFDWEDVPQFELMQRVIEIDLHSLRSGDPRSNILIRDRDTLYIPVDIGVFYMMGEINRPGVYSFGGRDITIKQAVAVSGGFSALAWPSRCEVIRREPGTDKQMTIPVNLDRIFAGLEEDFFLRDDDIINVGTDIVAPFLFVIRNSFRFTYGFGFVYDRNFADKDSYNAKFNPYNVQVERSTRQGLPF